MYDPRTNTMPREQDRRQYGPPATHRGGNGWLLFGLAVAGLAAVAYLAMSPDLNRYMKIRNM